jgi:hypothetical protein
MYRVHQKDGVGVGDDGCRFVTRCLATFASAFAASHSKSPWMTLGKRDRSDGHGVLHREVQAADEASLLFETIAHKRVGNLCRLSGSRRSARPVSVANPSVCDRAADLVGKAPGGGDA